VKTERDRARAGPVGAQGVPKGTMHENFSRRDDVKGPSDRAFGATFAVVFLLIALWPLLGGEAPRGWALAVAAAFLLAALIRPALLASLNRLWLRLGLALHWIVNPIVMGLIFFLMITPIAVIMRLLGRDQLRLKWDAQARTYWIERDPPGPPPATMKQQF
jgi:hypothetical protein